MTLSMSAQQEFLPTNLLIDANTFGITLIVGVLLCLVLSFTALFTESKKVRVLAIVGTFLAIMGTVVLSTINMVEIQTQEAEVPATNKANLITNIETVYDVDWVRVDKAFYNNEPVEVFLSQDEVVYNALVIQDPETFEPSVTLITGDEEPRELRKN